MSQMKRFELKKSIQFASRQQKESYNTLKTNIRFLGQDKRVLCISSVSPDEGKSVVSINLAFSLARANLKVLYVDADIRNSVFLGRFRFNGQVFGLADYLLGMNTQDEIFYKTDIEGFDVIPSGKYSVNPTGILQGKEFKDLIAVCRERYDYVIIDTPPIGLVIDAAIISESCDGSILVTQSGKIRRRYVSRAISQLKQSGTDFVGVVLNKVTMDTGVYGKYGSYGSYGKYGTYGYYGKDPEK